MQSYTKTIIVIIGLLVFSLTGIISSHAGSGGNQPGPTPTPKYLPDLKPVSLFFDKDCNLMVKIKNVGKGKFVGPRTGFLLFKDGGWVSDGSHNLILFPDSTVTVKVCIWQILGSWVEEKRSWRYVINLKDPIQGLSLPAKYVEESNDTNNSITKELVCGKYLQRPLPLPRTPMEKKKNLDLRERLPVTKPPPPIPLPKKKLDKR